MNIYLSNLSPSRQAALYALAVIGFIALVGAGMWLAVYSSRYVPVAVSKVGSAAVALSSIFVSASSSLSVVPTASTTLPFGDGASTPDETPDTTPSPTPVLPTPGQETGSAYIPNTPVTPHGLSDLVVTIGSVGYATDTSFNGFVASPTISASRMGAVKFSVKNVGTNVSGAWNFSASLPSNPVTVYPSGNQQSLSPGDWIEFVLDFSPLLVGSSTVSITVDPSNQVPESNEDNNGTSATIVVIN